MADAPLEDLIRRYETGDRDPDLLRQLNEAAWTGFHDPWEAAKPTGRHPVTGELVEPPSFDPKAVRPFDGDTIQRFLEHMKYKHYRQGRDYFLISFNYLEETDRCLKASLLVEGKQDEVFKLLITPDRRVPAERFDRAFRLCNTWNDRFRWPRAYVEMPPRKAKEGEPEGREPASALLALDFQILLRGGLSQELFNTIVKEVLATSWQFWELAHDEYGL